MFADSRTRTQTTSGQEDTDLSKGLAQSVRLGTEERAEGPSASDDQASQPQRGFFASKLQVRRIALSAGDDASIQESVHTTSSCMVAAVSTSDEIAGACDRTSEQTIEREASEELRCSLRLSGSTRMTLVSSCRAEARDGRSGQDSLASLESAELSSRSCTKHSPRTSDVVSGERLSFTRTRNSDCYLSETSCKSTESFTSTRMPLAKPVPVYAPAATPPDASPGAHTASPSAPPVASTADACTVQAAAVAVTLSSLAAAHAAP
eukprot:739117-Pleurochrysis_carterae.AAC.1